jgi:hypothetical protein
MVQELPELNDNGGDHTTDEGKATLHSSEQRWKQALEEAEQYRIYERVPPEKPYGSLDALLEAEIGVNVETSKKIISLHSQELARDPEVRELRAAGGKKGGRGNKNLAYIISKVSRQYGTSAAYLVRRLKRDVPAIAEALGRGEYPSARSAAKAAGIIKELTPLQAGIRAWNRISTDERAAFRSFSSCQP